MRCIAGCGLAGAAALAPPGWRLAGTGARGGAAADGGLDLLPGVKRTEDCAGMPILSVMWMSAPMRRHARELMNGAQPPGDAAPTATLSGIVSQCQEMSHLAGGLQPATVDDGFSRAGRPSA